MADRYVFDTNVIQAFTIEAAPGRLFVSSVVLAELITAANDDKEIRAYQRAWKLKEAAGELLLPTSADWLMASKILYWLAQARKKQAGGKSPKRPPAAKQELAMDALLAVTARREGVTVITNDHDFEAIRYYLKGLKLQKYPFA